MNDWQTFAARQPLLGERLEIRFSPTQPFPNNPFGTVQKIESLGGGWISITTDIFVAAAIRPDYQYRVLPPLTPGQ